MKTRVFAFITGFILAAILAIPVIKVAMNDKYNFGRSVGWLDGSLEVQNFLQKHFLSQRQPKAYTDAYIQKTGGIYIVEKNGVKTIVANQY